MTLRSEAEAPFRYVRFAGPVSGVKCPTPITPTAVWHSRGGEKGGGAGSLACAAYITWALAPAGL